MKRKGFYYEKMADWEFLKQAQKTTCKNKGSNFAVKLHKKNWIKNLVEIQDNILSGNMKTGEYHHEQRISGQGKLRNITKLDFHPSHIQHQALVMVCNEDIDKSLIRHTYASRKGLGQHHGAEQLNKWVQQYCRDGGEFKIYLQLDICKYYDNILHSLIRARLNRKIKDKRFVDAFLEPFEKFTASGKSIPLGIRLSPATGNLVLSPLDRIIKEELKCKCYLRYLDDMVLLCRNKGEAHRFAAKIKDWCNSNGFELHEPKIDKVANGIDFLGYVCYPYKGMFWRTSDKKAWLKRRSKVKNKKRLREIDAAAYGYIVHGNKHCRKLYTKMGGINFEKLGFVKPSQKDKNGKRILEAQQLPMSAVLSKPIVILDIEGGVETSHGRDRVVMLINFMESTYKLIVNAPMKDFFLSLWNKGVTKVQTMFVDRGGKHYDFVQEQTNILEIHHREIEEVDGKTVYKDNSEIVII